jgi:hypothetical protein
VRALGAGVLGFQVGQAVFGITRFGGYAGEVSGPEAAPGVRWMALMALLTGVYHLSRRRATDLVRDMPMYLSMGVLRGGGLGCTALSSP